MRVVHVITKGDVGGAQTHVAELATAQRDAGLAVTVMTGLDGPAMDVLRDRGLPVVIEPAIARSVDLRRDAAALATVRRGLHALAPDLVHAHSSKAGLLARFAARRLRTPAVYTAHGWPFQPGASARQRVVSRVGETVAGHWWGEVICLTEAEASIARRLRVVPAGRVHVVPNGLPDIPAAQRSIPTPGATALVMVARFAPPKEQIEVVRALARLADRTWTMTFVGDGPGLVACRAEAAASGVGDHIVFAGHRDDVPALLARSDVGLLWSRYEGMPLALLEAMRAGLACVSNDLPGSRALLGGDGGVIVPRQTVALAGALDALLADPARRAALAASARRRYLQEFTVATMVERTAEVYDAAVRRGGSEPPGRPAAAS